MDSETHFNRHIEEQRFQLLVNSVSDYAIYMLDLDGRVVSWNAGARRFKGYEPDEIIGQHFSQFLTDVDREAGVHEAALRTATETGRFEAEGWRVRKDGSRFWAHVVIDPIYDDSGSHIGFAKITRDITDKRESEQQFRESERRFRLLVQSIHDYAIYMLDTEGRVTNWNAGAQRIKGYKTDEILGHHFSKFYTREDAAAGVPQHALETALREGKYESEALRVRKDGTEFWAHVVIDPIYDDSGAHIGFAKITRDVTDRRQAQQDLDDARQSLFQAQKLQALGELTGGIAHDFNNLMTVIRGSADLLSRGNLDEEKRRRYLDAIIETSDRASTLTSHLLAFGRRQPLKAEVIDLNQRLDAFVQVVARTLGGRIEVQLDAFRGLWPIEVDATQLETALLNAAINARDAMPDGGTITITTRNAPDPLGDKVCVALTDTGSGMSAEVLQRAFEPFFTTKSVGKGTGLGLSQIHGFAAQSGGSAEIESVVGRGTTIRLLLPRSTKIAPPSEEQRPTPAGGRGKTVLLVEDNEHVREFARTLLQDLHYRVVSACSADEALAILDRDSVDVLFSDVVMPGQSGIELARLARARRPGLPVLLATGYSEEIVGGVAEDFGIIRKPYGADTLGAALVTTLAHCGGADG